MRKTKTIQMLVTVRVPRDTTAIQARREVRTLLSDKCMYAMDDEDIRAVSVRALPRA